MTTKSPDILNATQSGSIENSVNTADQVDVNTVMHGKPIDTFKATYHSNVDTAVNNTVTPLQLMSPDTLKAAHLGSLETSVNPTERTFCVTTSSKPPDIVGDLHPDTVVKAAIPMKHQAGSGVTSTQSGQPDSVNNIKSSFFDRREDSRAREEWAELLY